MSYCVMCGSPVPEGQSCCSMCCGDPYYGNDGYYLAWLEEQERQEMEEQQEIEAAIIVKDRLNCPNCGAFGPIPMPDWGPDWWGCINCHHRFCKPGSYFDIFCPHCGQWNGKTGTLPWKGECLKRGEVFIVSSPDDPQRKKDNDCQRTETPN